MSQKTLPRPLTAPNAAKDTALRLALNNFACAVAIREKQPEGNEKHPDPQIAALSVAAEEASLQQYLLAEESLYVEINAFVANYVANLLCIRTVDRAEDDHQ